jgi:hypothetical protein
MDEEPRPSELDIAIRAFGARPRAESERDPEATPPRRQAKRTYPSEALVFDTETTTGPSQRLKIGVWRLYADRPGAEPGITCVEEGLFYADDLPSSDPAGFARLTAYVTSHDDADVAPGFPSRLLLMSASDWLQKRLFRYGYQHRNRCAVVGLNLNFDLGRLASHWAPAGGYYRGGFSLGMWGEHDRAGVWHDRKFHPRLRMKAIDPRRTLYAWGSLKDPDGKGVGARFVDLHTLAFALTDRNHTLETACAAFGDPFEKDAIEYGVIDDRSLTYARDDVLHTARLYRACLAELARHEGVALDPARLYSPATVGVRYLEAFGVDQPLRRFVATAPAPDPSDLMVEGKLDPRLVGWATSGFFGGRAEARLVRTPVPVTVVDATSMYAAVNANLRTWEVLTADRIEAVDATSEVLALLATPDLLELCLRRETWAERIGVTLVELERPDSQILPVRAWYDPASRDPGIGVNPLTYDGRLWYLLPDVLASTLLTGRAPVVARAVRLVGVGRQRMLRPVALRGGRVIDPRIEDPFARFVEERTRIKGDASISKPERERLDQFLKITASATSYGVLARFDRKELADAVPVTVYGPDELPSTKRVLYPEDPGPYTFPPSAATITAAARLMLALLERLVTDAGGTYVFCDTDSMAIVAEPSGSMVACPTPDGTGRVRALDRATIEGLLRRFDRLSPFEPGLEIPVWKVEHDSLDRPLTCYAISAKRYLLYRPDVGRGSELVDVGDGPEEEASDDESAEMTDWSEHGLGLYLAPEVDARGRPLRDAKGRRTWVRDAWTWVLADAAAASPTLPPWAAHPALTRFTISSPALADWFRGRDRDLPHADRMRPGGFGLLAHPSGGDAANRMPASPYETDPDRWADLAWYDRNSGEPLSLTTLDPVNEPERFAMRLAAGAVRVRTLGDVLATYGQRPEHKSLDPDGSPTASRTVGLLRRRPVRSTPARTHLAGKEGNKLLQRVTGVVTDQEDYRTDFGLRVDPWATLIVPVLRRMGATEVVRRTNPAWRRSVERVIEDGHRPRQGEREAALTAAVVAYATTRVGAGAVGDELSVLAAFLSVPARAAARVCACGCGLEVRSPRAKWFSEAHRKHSGRDG